MELARICSDGRKELLATPVVQFTEVCFHRQGCYSDLLPVRKDRIELLPVQYVYLQNTSPVQGMYCRRCGVRGGTPSSIEPPCSQRTQNTASLTALSTALVKGPIERMHAVRADHSVVHNSVHALYGDTDLELGWC
jgi:hypothetical protein